MNEQDMNEILEKLGYVRYAGENNSVYYLPVKRKMKFMTIIPLNKMKEIFKAQKINPLRLKLKKVHR